MTIIEMLNKINPRNKLMEQSLEIIKDNFTNLVNDNYELVVKETGELNVKIPSLEKRNEYVYNSLTEYKYSLIMCMKVQELKNAEAYNFMLSKFMESYKDKLDLLFKDVNTINKLKEKIIKTKNNIDYITLASLITGVIGAISLCLFDFTNTTKNVFIAGIIICFTLSVVIQVTKESRVRKVIDAYISLIKTDWYKDELLKQYAFLCNFTE
ncbi:hypothetical protein [Clostridium sp.]|uniref:hypothetical protein n=1 Tax=Clostridium sp. TaxID=1506 RepID=UPI00283F4A4E|nr:hypothetical protein [Clostridium sp.]MDR3597903.1 hypothetical protein [Clostridium sp.]